MCAAATVLLTAFLGAFLGAQDAAPPLRFDVASVKRSPPDDGAPRPSIWGTIQPGGRWSSRNASLDKIIRSAYPDHPLDEQLVGGPDWVRSTEFDITASAPSAAATRDEIQAMARTLLADRFKLKVRLERRELGGYGIVVARADGTLGPGLKPAAVDCTAVRAARQRGETVPAATTRACAVMVRDSDARVRLEAGAQTIDSLARVLSAELGAPIVDATGLSGVFDISLEFARDVAGAQSGDTPSIFTAISEQLGLRLERRRVSVEVLVIENAELPAPD